MKFEEAIKYIQRTNSFKLGDAVKRLTSQKPDTLTKQADVDDPARRMATETRKEKRRRRRESLTAQVRKAYRSETGY